MKTENLTELFDQLNGLKSVFKYGQKLIPIVQNLLDFMKETAPMLENINLSISESTNKIPKAANQINNVTSATELATTEILDIVDIISSDIVQIENNLKEIFKAEESKNEIIKKIKILHVNGDDKSLFDEYTKVNHTETAHKNISELISKIKTNSYNITLSLQVQDITSQQLAAVSHLIYSVQERLSSLVHNIHETNENEFDRMNIAVPEGASFDPNARYSKEGNKQDHVDLIMNDQLKKTSQAEIDKLFS